MLWSDRKRWVAVILIYAGAITAGYIMSWLGVPLPWMIGPMVLAGAVSALSDYGSVPKITRPVGQVVVAGVVGLAFTPSAVTAVVEQIVPMLSVAVMTILAGFIVAAVLMRLTQMDVISASLASVPGGPVEMAALASRYGVAPGPVAFAQTLRIALLVLVIPPALLAINGGRSAALVLTGGEVDHAGAALLLAVAAAGGFIFRWVRMSSPFFLGPLAFAAAASALSLPVSMPPYWVLASAQVLLGLAWLHVRSRNASQVAHLYSGRSHLNCSAFGHMCRNGFRRERADGNRMADDGARHCARQRNRDGADSQHRAARRRHCDRVSRRADIHHHSLSAVHFRHHRPPGKTRRRRTARRMLIGCRLDRRL